MAKTKAQSEYAQEYFKENPEVDKLWANSKGEFFTDISWATNSLEKDENGKLGTLEVFANEPTPKVASEKKSGKPAVTDSKKVSKVTTGKKEEKKEVSETESASGKELSDESK